MKWRNTKDNTSQKMKSSHGRDKINLLRLECYNTYMTRMVENLCREAKRLGASEAVHIAAADIVVDDRALLKCQVPLCSHYGIDLMCPPNVLPASQFREILKCYHDAILVKVDIPSGDLRIQSGRPEPRYVDAAKDTRAKLHQIICHLESNCIEKGRHFAAGFIGGSCPLCDTCVGAKSGLPCSHPFKARPAMEAMGIDVMSTVEKAGLHLSFGNNTERSWIGLVLVA